MLTNQAIVAFRVIRACCCLVLPQNEDGSWSPTPALATSLYARKNAAPGPTAAGINRSLSRLPTTLVLADVLGTEACPLTGGNVEAFNLTMPARLRELGKWTPGLDVGKIWVRRGSYPRALLIAALRAGAVRPACKAQGRG